MLKKFLSLSVTGLVSLALFACDDDSNSVQAPEQNLPQVSTESSSSEASVISSSSQNVTESSSSEELPLQDTTAEKTHSISSPSIPRTLNPIFITMDLF